MRRPPGGHPTVEDMNASQQHMLDLYRAAQHQEPAPPAPGSGDVRAVREIRTWMKFRAVLAGRVATRRLRPTAAPAPASSPRVAVPAPVPVQPVQQGADRLPDVCGGPVQR